jgi:short-subunit dehydrogenase
MALPPPTAGSTCLVTGASSGIGAEFARQLGARGHNLLLVARREERLRELAAEIERDSRVRVDVAQADLADPQARGRLLEHVAAGGASVEILVNNAGFARVGDVHEHPEDQIGMIRLDVEALVALSSAFVPPMVERGRGAIINVASIAAFQPIPSQATYAAAKAFVLSFSEALAAEVRRSGVTVTALCPGPVATEFVEVGQFKRTMDQMGPSFIWAAPSDVAGAALEGADRGARVVVPGAPLRAIAFASRHSPRGLLLGPIASAYRRAIGE